MGKTIDSPIMDARYGSSVSISKLETAFTRQVHQGILVGIAEIYDFKNNSWEKVGNTITGGKRQTANLEAQLGCPKMEIWLL